jgi:diaminohydroxyphosphoribosylaminopyrimidine deaminase/5-amino-6-(5-phosphoribosylamino)uracil reductase
MAPAATLDRHFLHYACRLAARHLGRTAPNPSVGCVIVREGQVLAAATTAPGGRPHAEAQALARCDARGATAYVTLEPCAHHGKTPPCAQALIDAGIARVVYACEDADPRVAGRGAAMLRAAGVAVEQHNLAEADALQRGFFRRVRHGLPEVTLKLATSADGKMTNPSGERWITGTAARRHGHALRLQHEALLTGIGTVLDDDPQLNLRLPGIAHALPRIVCDRHLRLPLASQLVRSAESQPVWVMTTAEAVEQRASHATDLRERGVVLHVAEDAALPLRAVLEAVAGAGINRLLVEAGPVLSAAFLREQLVDTLFWYRAPTTLGGPQTALERALEKINASAARPQFLLGGDGLSVYELASCLPD